DVEAGEELATLKGHLKAVNSIALAPDGKTLVSGSESALKVWDVTAEPMAPSVPGHTSPLYHLAFRPPSQLPASTRWTIGAPGKPAGINLWSLPKGQKVRGLTGFDRGPTSAVFSPDGKYLACSCWDFKGKRGGIQLYLVATGEPIRQMLGHTEPVRQVAYSP